MAAERGLSEGLRYLFHIIIANKQKIRQTHNQATDCNPYIYGC